MEYDSNNFFDLLIWSFWFFFWVSAIMIWVRCLFDMFGDSTLSGWAKASWALVLAFLPWIGALIYLIVRGRSMGERQMAAIERQRAAQEQYIQSVAGGSATPADQIASAKSLHDSGAITQEEYDTLKAKALA